MSTTSRIVDWLSIVQNADQEWGSRPVVYVFSGDRQFYEPAIYFGLVRLLESGERRTTEAGAVRTLED